MLSANNDYQAVQAWLALQESEAARRAYRKEAERLILWAIVERSKPLSSLTTEDATAYRAFLRRPAPRGRWVGPARPRMSPEWRPFAGALAARSVGHALSVLGALFRWLIEQRYLLANPFAGIKVRGGGRSAALDASRAFSDGEWAWIRVVADGLEWSQGWSVPAAQRLRFVLDFGYACGLRAGELVGLRLGQLQVDGHGQHWLDLVGKGGKAGRVAVPSLARAALDAYLAQRGLPTTRSRWDPRRRMQAFSGHKPLDIAHHWPRQTDATEDVLTACLEGFLKVPGRPRRQRCPVVRRPYREVWGALLELNQAGGLGIQDGTSGESKRCVRVQG